MRKSVHPLADQLGKAAHVVQVLVLVVDAFVDYTRSNCLAVFEIFVTQVSP